VIRPYQQFTLRFSGLHTNRTRRPGVDGVRGHVL